MRYGISKNNWNFHFRGILHEISCSEHFQNLELVQSGESHVRQNYMKIIAEKIGVSLNQN